MKKIVKKIVAAVIVCAMTLTPLCTKVAAQENDLLPIPDGLTTEEEIIAACPEGYRPVFSLENSAWQPGMDMGEANKSEKKYYGYEKIDVTESDLLPIPDGLSTKEEIIAACPEGYQPFGVVSYNQFTGEVKTTYYGYTKKSVDQNNGDDTEAQPAVQEVLKGDIDQDGKITLKDAQKLLRVVLKIEPIDSITTRLGDYNEDAGLTLEDASLVLKRALFIGAEQDCTISATITEVRSVFEGGRELLLDGDTVLSTYGVTIYKDGKVVPDEELTVGAKIKYNAEYIQTTDPAYVVGCTKIVIQ